MIQSTLKANLYLWNARPRITQNLKSRTPDRPKVDFKMTFGVHLAIDFHEILIFLEICVNHQNAFKQSIWEGSALSQS